MKLKAWDNHEKRWAKTHEIEGELFINPEVGDTGVFYIHDHSASGKLHYTVVHSTGLLDKNGLTDIYEGDIIDENSNIRGNIYETVDKRTTDLVITGMGTEAWRSTEQAAMDRGCKYAK